MSPSRRGSRAPSRQLPRTINTDQYASICAALPPDRTAFRRDRLILEVMWNAGLRVSEVAALAPGDLKKTSTGYLIDVREGKGCKARSVFVGNDLASRYTQWAEELPRGACDLLPALEGKTKGRGVSTRFIRQRVNELSEYAEVRVSRRDGSTKPIGPHILRHSYATRMLAKGMPLTYLQQQLGHSSIQTTAIYLHVENASLTKMVQLITDEDRHIDSAVADYQEKSLDRRIRVHLDELPAASSSERVALAQISAVVGELGVEATLDNLKAIQPDQNADSSTSTT